jgi:hypothetical protein
MKPMPKALEVSIELGERGMNPSLTTYNIIA